MRTLLLCTALAVASLALSGCTGYYDDTGDETYEEPYYYDDGGDYQADPQLVFDNFDDLDFWGQWMELYPYGEVWRPSVIVGWRPYDNGNWIWTDDGWTWVSYEPFGWITYHYGMWVYDIVWGWLWIPGYTWSPGCVDWLVYDDYVAWAPCHPDDFYIGDPWIVNEIYVWHVVPTKDFTQNDVGRYAVRYKSNYSVHDRSSVIHHAPSVDLVERATGRTIRAVPVELTQRGKFGDRTIQELRLPQSERERVARYRERIAQKIRADRNGTTGDRIRVRRNDRTRQQKPETREEPQGGRTDKEPSRPAKQRPETPQQPRQPQKKEPDRPQKQEPEKKQPDRPQKQQPEKQQPEKKQPEKKQPEKKQPEKKQPRESARKKPKRG